MFFTVKVVYAQQEEIGMNNSRRHAGFVPIWVWEITSILDKQHGILSIPRFDGLILPNPRTKDVLHLIVHRRETGNPIIGPLFVHMVCSALMWNGCGKKNVIRVFRKQFDESVSKPGRDMLCYLQ